MGNPNRYPLPDAANHARRDYSFDANGNVINEALTVANARVDSRVAVYDDADRQKNGVRSCINASSRLV